MLSYSRYLVFHRGKTSEQACKSRERPGRNAERDERKSLVFFIGYFSPFDVFYEVMNNHLAYNVIPDHNARGWSSIMWNFKKKVIIIFKCLCWIMCGKIKNNLHPEFCILVFIPPLISHISEFKVAASRLKTNKCEPF